MTRSRVVVLTLFLSLVLLEHSLPTTFSVTSARADVKASQNCLKIYVVALEGVATYRVENSSEIVRGVFEAAAINKTSVLLGFKGIWRLDFKEVEFNAICAVIADWTGYEVLVEFGSDVVVINAHGEYLPVPRGYSKEEWVGKIADAMLNRQMTWIHLGGYPFYYVQHQKGDIETWEDKGFQELTSYIGKGDVNCLSPPDCPYSSISGFGGQSLGDWRKLWDVYTAMSVRPLKASDFKDLLILDIYTYSCDNERLYPGAVIRFLLANETSDYGFYVHLGAWQFRDLNNRDIDNPDFYMGYVATAAAIWSEVGFSTYLLYCGVPEDIETANATGRTQGLDQAESFLQQAINVYEQGKYKTAIALAYQARGIARSAVKPINYLQVYGPYTLVLGIVSLVIFQVAWERKRKAKLRKLGYIKCPLCNNYIAPNEMEEHKITCLQNLKKTNID